MDVCDIHPFVRLNPITGFCTEIDCPTNGPHFTIQEKKVPLTFNGEEVGLATIKPDGTIVAIFGGTVGRELYHRLFADTFKGLSISFEEARPDNG